MANSGWMERLERLEVRVTELERLPGRIEQVEHRLAAVESQVSQLREEMAVEFSATRQDVREAIAEKWHHTLALHEDLVERIKTLGEHFGAST